MKVTLIINKTVDENAQIYFEKSKRAKKKIDGVLKAIDLYTKKLVVLKTKETEDSENFKEEKQRLANKKKQKNRRRVFPRGIANFH